jgi:hypothetical protein
MKNNNLDCSRLNKLFNIDGPSKILLENNDFEGKCSYKKELNPFYGKKHTEETKDQLRKITLELCKDQDFKMSRSNYGEKNGMYQSARFGKLNPMWGKKHSEETKIKQSNKRKEWFKNNDNPLKGKPCPENVKKLLSERNSKEYKLISPNGQYVKIKNLTKFAKDNNLSIACLRHVVSGRNKTHRGWKNAS